MARSIQGGRCGSGGELIERLNSEDIGIPVYYTNPNEEKTDYVVDRKTGEDDITIRKKVKRNEKLLGLVIPTADGNFAFLGENEGGFVFQVSQDRKHKFTRETTNAFYLGWKRFSDYISEINSPDPNGSKSFILREENNPDDFIKTVEESVEHQRELNSKKIETRARVRDELVRKLFGQ